MDDKTQTMWDEFVARHKDGLIKVAIRTTHEDGEVTVETPWARAESTPFRCRLENSPFFSSAVALGDLVRVVPDEGGELFVVEVIEHCGTSTVWVSLEEGVDHSVVTDFFSAHSCWYEGMGSSYFSVAIPAEVRFPMVDEFLTGKEEARLLTWGVGHYQHGPYWKESK